MLSNDANYRCASLHPTCIKSPPKWSIKNRPSPVTEDGSLKTQNDFSKLSNSAAGNHTATMVGVVSVHCAKVISLYRKRLIIEQLIVYQQSSDTVDLRVSSSRPQNVRGPVALKQLTGQAQAVTLTWPVPLIINKILIILVAGRLNNIRWNIYHVSRTRRDRWQLRLLESIVQVTSSSTWQIACVKSTC